MYILFTQTPIDSSKTCIDDKNFKIESNDRVANEFNTLQKTVKRLCTAVGLLNSF